MDVFSSIFQWCWDKIIEFANWLISFLPHSPFQQYLNDFSNLPYLHWLNWFVPFNDFVIIGTAWLTVIALFYGYQILMRWIKVIGE